MRIKNIPLPPSKGELNIPLPPSKGELNIPLPHSRQVKVANSSERAYIISVGHRPAGKFEPHYQAVSLTSHGLCPIHKAMPCAFEYRLSA